MTARLLLRHSRPIFSSSSSFSFSSSSSRSHKSLPFSFQRALLPFSSNNNNNNEQTHIPLTKIVATIGPASEQFPMLSQLHSVGLNIMRINFSHATYEEADLRTTNLNKCEDKDIVTGSGKGKDVGNFPNQVVKNISSVMLDTQGPEIRTGSFDNGVKEVELVAGNEVKHFPHTHPLLPSPSSNSLIPSPPLPPLLSPPIYSPVGCDYQQGFQV